MISEAFKSDACEFDPVNKPSHYAEGRKYEPIDVIIDWKLDYRLGNAVKYISRAGRKHNTVEDLEKSVWYINHMIAELHEKKAKSIDPTPRSVSPMTFAQSNLQEV